MRIREYAPKAIESLGFAPLTSATGAAGGAAPTLR